jgi:hypothetical protein
MDEAAIVATTDIGKALQMLRRMPYADETFRRGVRFVSLAHQQQMRLGYRSDNVECWVRYGFRTIARWAMTGGIH